jgi:hypothetical protein
MKIVYAILAVSACLLPISAQQSSSNQQGSPTQPVRMEMVCRDMSTTGNYLAPSETMIGNKACHAVSVERLGDSAAANAQATAPAQSPATPAAAPTAQAYFASSVLPTADLQDIAIRVYVTDSGSWSARGGWTGNQKQDAAAGATANSKEQAVMESEVDKLVTEVNRQCPEVIITSDVSKAVFAVTVDHEGTNRMNERNKITVFNHSGDDIYSSAATRKLADLLPDACKAILSSAKK